MHRVARDHLRDRQPGAVALGLQAHEPVADPRQRRQHDAVGDRDAAERPGLGERAGRRRDSRRTVIIAFMVRIGRWTSPTCSSRGSRSSATRCLGWSCSTPTLTSGENDPDGMRQSPEELLACCVSRTPAAASSSRCTSPTATPPPTTWCSRRPRRLTGCSSRSAASTPTTTRSPRPSARSTVGARGIKLHPRAEQFTLDHPAVPVAVRAGRTSARCRS